VDHKIRAEEVCPIAACAIALRGAGEIELGILQESLLDFETGVKWISGILGHEEAKEIRTHACVEILADFQSDFDFFGEWRGNVLGDLIFRRLKTLETSEIYTGRF
jgi:hypothetical protein